MALISLPVPLVLSPLMPLTAGTSLGSAQIFTFNGAGDQLAFLFQSQSATPPDQAAFYVSSITTGGSLECTLQTVDTSTGAPSGTLVSGSATATVAVAAPTGAKTATGMAGTATLTPGAVYAIVIAAPSGFGGNFAATYGSGNGNGWGYPYMWTKDSAGAWTKNTVTGSGGYFIGLADSSGAALRYPGFLGAATSYALVSFSDATNPDERGNRFALPYDCAIGGAAVYLTNSIADAASHALSLYSGHTGAPVQLATSVFDGDITLGTSLYREYRFAAPVALTAGTAYALALKATGATAVNVQRFGYPSAAQAAALMGSTAFYSTSRDGGAGNPSGGGNAFVDDATAVYGVWPLISQISDGAGGAGGGLLRHPGMNGGFGA